MFEFKFGFLDFNVPKVSYYNTSKHILLTIFNDKNKVEKTGQIIRFTYFKYKALVTQSVAV